MTTNIAPYTNGIVSRMFFDTADLNYIGARAAYIDERNWDFWWLTLHAIEKYLKCILLMNGASAVNGGHDLPKLLAKVKQLDNRLVPTPSVKPKIAQLTIWPGYSDDAFLTRLNDYGSASNRYGTYGYSLLLSDLLRADQLVYWARRHARPLKQTLSDGKIIDWVKVLSEAPGFWIQHTGPLESIARLPFRNARRWPLTRLNAAFFPDMRHRLKSWRSSANNPPIAEWCTRLTGAPVGSDTHVTAYAVVKWTLDNIQLVTSDRKELQDLLKAHPTP